MFLIHWKKAENGPLAFDRNVWEIWSKDPLSFRSAPRLLVACGSESEALLHAAAMGKKPWLTVRDDAVSQVWRLEDIG
jgi:hypothetical protein